MPDRLVRDELLTSERYWSVSAEARNLFVSMLLTVDDAARMTASNFALRTKCMAGTVTADRVEKILAELVDVDLVRLYEVGGARYAFIPRFRNRRRYVSSSKIPPPPSGINDLPEKKADSGMTQDGLGADLGMTQDGPKSRGVGVGVGVGVGKSETRRERKVFTPPSVEQVRDFVDRGGWQECNPEQFVAHFSANGWRVGGKAPMRSWEAAVKSWHYRRLNEQQKPRSSREEDALLNRQRKVL